MDAVLSLNWMLIASGWLTVNGVLHDIFVVRAHKGGYDRELLRLLMDGHVLILSGVLLLFSYLLTRSGNVYGAATAAVIAIGMIVYCLMIFPFLKSLVTLLLSLVLLAVSIRYCISLR
jgi:hypothetical protein